MPPPAPLPHPHPRDCAEEQLNGPGPSRETLIFLRGDPARPLRVFCDMETDGGGWLVGLGTLGAVVGGYTKLYGVLGVKRGALGVTADPAGEEGGDGEVLEVGGTGKGRGPSVEFVGGKWGYGGVRGVLGCP